jgi:hypothetical protein
MSYDQLNAEMDAVQRFIRLIEQAKECKIAYDHARMPLPESLQHFFGMNGAKPEEKLPSHIPPPERPEMPPGGEDDWIWISVEKAGATNVTLAILRGANEPIRARDLVATVMNILPDVHRGTIANLGNRLEGDTIERSKEGWSLINPEKAGLISGGLFWGPPELFTKQELAAHRRDAILHVLSFFQSGLQQTQLAEQLRKCPWVRAPVNKELVQDDIEILRSEGKIRRRGTTTKWEIKKEQDEN